MFKTRITNYPTHFNKAPAANLKASYNLKSVNAEEKMRDVEYFYKSIKEPPVKSRVPTARFEIRRN